MDFLKNTYSDAGDQRERNKWYRRFLVIVVVIGAFYIYAHMDDNPNVGTEPKAARVSNDEDYKIVGQERLKATLRDPDSLQIISERIVRPGRNGSNVGYECQYRAKNGFGGYNVETFYTE